MPITVVRGEPGDVERRSSVRDAVHAFRPPRRSRRVQHGAAEYGIHDVVGALAREHVRPRLEAGDVAVDHDLGLEPRCEVGGDRRPLGEASVRHKRSRVGIFDDVTGFITGQMPVDRREPQARPLHSSRHLRELGAVRTQQRDAVTGAHAAASQRPHECIGVRVRFRKRARAVLGDEGERVRSSPGPIRGQHAAVRRRVQGLDVVHETEAMRGSTPASPPIRSATPSSLCGPSRPRRARRTPRRCPPNPRTGSRRSP